MRTKYTDKIKTLKGELIHEIIGHLLSNNIVKVMIDGTVNCDEYSFNHLTLDGAELIIQGKFYQDIDYNGFSIEELNYILSKLNPLTYKIVEKAEVKIAFRIAVWEYERGWGSKLDDWMVCLSKEDAEAYKVEFNSHNTEKTAPDWYMQAEGEPQELELTLAQYDHLVLEGRKWLSILKKQ